MSDLAAPLRGPTHRSPPGTGSVTHSSFTQPPYCQTTFPPPTPRPQRGRIRAAVALFLFLAPLTLVACDDSLGGFCTAELRVHLVPADTTIAVSQAFTASVALSTCGGRQQLSDTFTWRSQDVAVVSVDSTTGRVTGRGPGETWVQATGQRYGLVDGPRVVVLAATP